MLIFQFKTFANCFLKVIIQRRLSESPQTRLNLRRSVAVEDVHKIIPEKKTKKKDGGCSYLYLQPFGVCSSTEGEKIERKKGD